MTQKTNSMKSKAAQICQGNNPTANAIGQSRNPVIHTAITNAKKQSAGKDNKTVSSDSVKKISFTKHGQSAELLHKGDLVKVRIDDNLLIMDNITVNPMLNKRIGTIVSEVQGCEDDVILQMKTSEEVVKIPKMFLCLSSKI